MVIDNDSDNLCLLHSAPLNAHVEVLARLLGFHYINVHLCIVQ